MSPSRVSQRVRFAVVVLASALVLSACASPGAGGPIVVGTTSSVVALDPAATRDATTVAVLREVYPRLMERNPETGAFTPALAATAEFTTANEFTVTLRSGLTFANGNALTASDVVFSFERQRAIQEQAGPVRLLSGITSIAATDSTTVVFTLERADDASFPAVLAGPAGAILDEQVFSADAITDDQVIVSRAPFAGRWKVSAESNGQLTLLTATDNVERPSGPVVVIETRSEPERLSQRLAAGEVDAAFGDFSVEQVATMLGADGVTSHAQASGGIRMLAFDFDTMPFGNATEQADSARAGAVRLAFADLIDREALAAASSGAVRAEYGYLPSAMRTPPIASSTVPGEQGVLAAYGDGRGGPDIARATERLTSVGIETPVAIEIAAVSVDDPITKILREELVEQLEAGGLFDIRIVEVEPPLDRTSLSAARYPIVEYRWIPRG